MSNKVFRFGANFLESHLPATDFLPGSSNLESALSAISNLLGQGDDIKQGLDKLFVRTKLSSDPFVVLCNIRRWALDGLRDEDLLSTLKGQLCAPDPEACGTTSARRSKASRSITAKQARCILANAFIGNCTDVMRAHKDGWNEGGLDFRNMLIYRKYNEVGLSKLECLLTYFDVCGTLEGTDDDDRVITFELIRFVPLTAKDNVESGRVVGDGIVFHTGTMESPTRKTTSFVNFANPNYGYGKFISSCTQEEILLMCSSATYYPRRALE